MHKLKREKLCILYLTLKIVYDKMRYDSYFRAVSC